MLSGDRRLNLFRVLSVGFVAVLILRTAWISDDALITLRTALNLTHGWGPGYNATEAVQAYTHPLWFVLWIWIGSWTNQWILGVLLISLVCVVGATAILVWQVRSIGRLIVLIGLLVMSNAFIDFTTSGLESPLAFLSIAMLFALLPDPKHPITYWRFTLIGVTAAAVILTRFDLVVLIVIPLTVFTWQQRKNIRGLLITGAALLTPLLIWLTWSWVTYSTLLPNTYAAKTNAEIPRIEFVVQGFRYLWVSFENDPVTLVGLALGLGVGIALGPKLLRAWASGVLVYLSYVVWVGGDFMGGRFLAVPLLVALLVLAASPIQFANSPQSELVPITAGVVTVSLLFAGAGLTGARVTALVNPQEERWEVDQNFNAGIVDARGSSVSQDRDLKGLIDNLSLAFVNPDFVPIGDRTGLARSLRDLDKSTKNWPTNDGFFSLPSEVGVFCGFIGNVGIVTGPTTHLIDNCALTDRYLAERPFVPTESFAWKPGHFYREIPEGYVEAVANGDPKRMRDVADAYELNKLWATIRPQAGVP